MTQEEAEDEFYALAEKIEALCKGQKLNVAIAATAYLATFFVSGAPKEYRQELADQWNRASNEGSASGNLIHEMNSPNRVLH